MHYKTQANGMIKGEDIPHLVDPEFYQSEFDLEEVEDMELMAKGEYVEVSPEELENEKIRLKTMFGPEERTQISLRVFNSDLAKLKAMAKEEGMPYQTLITSLLHKIANKKITTILE